MKNTHRNWTPKKTDIKGQVAKLIANEIDRRQLTQGEAARVAGDAPSQISLVVCGRLRGFSLERLIAIANGLSIDVTLSTSVATRRRGRFALAAA